MDIGTDRFAEPAVDQATQDAIRRALNLVGHLEPQTAPDQYDVRKRALDAVLLHQAVQQRGIDVTRLGVGTLLLRARQGITQGMVVHQNMPASVTALDRAATKNKQLTDQLLSAHGVPVARGRVAQTQQEALAVFREIGPPAVATPVSGSGERKVIAGIRTEAEFRAATSSLGIKQGKILVEEMVSGVDLRIMTARGHAIASSLRIPANVVGDGRRTIRQLVAAKDAVRATNPYFRHFPAQVAPFTEHFLARQGLTPDAVPDDGQRVFLQFGANLSAGGEWYEVHGYLHPDLLRLAERAAACFTSASHVGVDIRAEQIDAGLDVQRAVVVKVNLDNEISGHVLPLYGKPDNVHLDLAETYQRDLAGATPGNDSRHKRPPRVRMRQIASLQRRATPWPNFLARTGPTPRQTDVIQLRNQFAAAGYPHAQFAGERLYLGGDMGTQVRHRSARSAISSRFTDNARLRALARAVGVPALGRMRSGGESLDTALHLLTNRPGEWSMRLTTAGGDRRRFRVRTAEDLRRRWPQAAEGRATVWLRQLPTGYACEVLFIDGEPAATLLLTPPSIIGDGRRTVNELIDCKVADRPSHPYLRHLPVRESLLTESSLFRHRVKRDDVLPAGKVVALARTPLDSLGPDTISLDGQPFPELTEYAAAITRPLGHNRIIALSFGLQYQKWYSRPHWALRSIDPEPVLGRFAYPGAGGPPDVYGPAARTLLASESYLLPSEHHQAGGEAA